LSFRRARTPSHKQTGGEAIQLPYCNNFSSLAEYDLAFRSQAIDFAAVIGPACLICGRVKCYRPIKPYQRTAIEVEPSVEGAVTSYLVLIARFQCRLYLRTFSLLPIQLLPYHQYTVTTIVLLLLLAQVARRAECLGLSAVAERQIPGDANTTGWLLSCWVRVTVAGLRRAHPWLISRFDLTALCPATDKADELNELYSYLAVLCPRGPPDGLFRIVHQYSQDTLRFFFGRSSQERGDRRVP